MRMSRDFIERVTASNGSVFTGPGTNSFLIGRNDITLVDPGPKIDEHIEKLIKLGEGKIKRILVTHTHRDHSPAAKVIGEILNVPLMGRLVEKDDTLQDKTFKPECVLGHGDLIETAEYTIESIHTPGHASNHLCFLIPEEKAMLTGDHIMNGSTVVIAHPDGSMKDYLNSLALLRKYSFNKIIQTTTSPLVSSDFNHNSNSAIVDLSLTKVVGKGMGKISAWYDNEWGFSNSCLLYTSDAADE